MRVLLAALGAVVLLATPGHAAPFSYKDPAGDATAGLRGFDIVSVSYATTGRRRVPENVVVTLTFAGEVARHPGVVFDATVGGSPCSYLHLEYTNSLPEPAATASTFCSPSGGTGTAEVAVRAEVTGSRVVFTVPLNALPPPLRRAGTVFSGFRANAFQADPLGTVQASLMDEATSSGRWVLG